MTDRPLMSIWEWAQYIQFHPWHLAQISTGIEAGSSNQCGGGMYEYAWQSSDKLSRREIEEALYEAEMLLLANLRFPVAPRYFTETVDFPRDWNRLNYSYPLTYTGHGKSVALQSKKLIEMGTEILTEIGDSVVAYSDTTGDGINDRATITATVPAGTTAGQIAVFFTATDRNALDKIEWEIYPVTVSITGTTATIIGNSYQLVKPDLRLTTNPQPLSATDANTYVTSVSVWTRTTDTTSPGSLTWENIWYEDCDAATCEVTLNSACFAVRNKEQGFVVPIAASYNATTEQFSRQYPDKGWRSPDRVTVNYKAGLSPDSSGKIQRRYAQALAKLATALLPNRSCGCDRADQRLLYYRDMPTDARSNTVSATQRNLEATERFFGVVGRGAVEAYALLQHEFSNRGILWGNS